MLFKVEQGPWENSKRLWKTRKKGCRGGQAHSLALGEVQPFHKHPSCFSVVERDPGGARWKWHSSCCYLAPGFGSLVAEHPPCVKSSCCCDNSPGGTAEGRKDLCQLSLPKDAVPGSLAPWLQQNILVAGACSPRKSSLQSEGENRSFSFHFLLHVGPRGMDPHSGGLLPTPCSLEMTSQTHQSVLC